MIHNNSKIITTETENNFTLEFDTSYYNKLTSDIIDNSLFIPDETTLSMVKETIEIKGEIKQGIIEGTDFAYYPTTISYEKYGISFFTMAVDNDTISSITLLENSKVNLVSGIKPFKSTKKDIEAIYGTKRQITTSHQNVNWLYNELGISFNFHELRDTVQNITIYSTKNVIAPSQINKNIKPLNSPVVL